MIRRPPRSTLFPTRTLFRSRHGVPLDVAWSKLSPAHKQFVLEGAPGFRGVMPFLERLREKRSEEHTSELQSRLHLVCRLLLEKKKKRLIHFIVMINTLYRTS